MTRAEYVARCREKLPVVMQEARRWLLWKSIPNGDKKPRKVPHYVTGKPRNGAMDTPEDVAQFATFDDAARAFQAGKYSGFGFALGRDDDGFWQGVDLDHLSAHPELQTIADALVATTYCEISPNEDGLHAIGHGGCFSPMGSTSDGIESYCSGRFFTVTGDALSTLAPVDLHPFIETELRPRRKPQASQPAGDGVVAESVTPETIRDLRSALLSMRADDRDLWIKLGLALFLLGDVGRGLWMEWSATSEKYDPSDAARTWDSFKRTQTDYRVVFSQAQRNGWVNTASKRVGSDSTHSNDADDAALYDLDQFALNGQSKELELLLLAAVFILGRLAILGQATVIYGKPNSGKTLLMLMLLRAGILSGEINAADIYFLNADDHFRGAVQKLKLAEQHGFKMLVPSHNGFKAEMLAAILRAHCLMGTARGKVLILDTLKKFMDLMNKSKGSEFMKSVREFVSHGGSVIMLAHTNKHRNDDGGLIYAGTADVVDDCDAAYTLDTVADDLTTRTRTVKFTNFKARGDNQLEASYQYSIAEGASYLEKLDSVRHLADENLREIQLKQRDAETLAKNAPVIDAINEAIECGFVKKTMLTKQVMAEAGFSNKTITQVLKQHTGASGTTAIWRITKGADNASIYSLNVDF